MELELQVVVTDPLRVVETELRSPLRAVCVLTVEAFKQPSKEFLKLKIRVCDGGKVNNSFYNQLNTGERIGERES